MYHLTSSEWECFLLSDVLKVSEKFGFKVPAHVITQSSDLSPNYPPVFLFGFLGFFFVVCLFVVFAFLQ